MDVFGDLVLAISTDKKTSQQLHNLSIIENEVTVTTETGEKVKLKIHDHNIEWSVA